MEKAVIYARYSSHSQGEQSIEGQISAAEKYAAGHGYTVVRTYVDRAMTGRNDNREAFQEMLHDCTKHLFSVIIVWKVDRIGRNREEILFNKYHMKKNGVRVEYVAENLGAGPESIILESLLEGMAEYYSVQLSQNIRRGRLESAKKHLALGPVPLGYKARKDRTFEVDPTTAPVVRRIFADYLAGKTMAEIIRALNAEGLRTGKNEPFTNNSLRKILHNEKYVGVYDYNNGEIRDEDAIPAIVDRETFYAVQELTKRNLRKRVTKTERLSDYVLTGKLYCGICGSMMVGESGTSHTGAVHNYYTCSKHKRERACPMHAIRQDELESTVLESVMSLLTDETIEEIAEAAYAYYKAEGENAGELDALKAELEECEAATRRIIDAIEAGLLSDSMKERFLSLEERKAQLKDAIEAARIRDCFRITKEHIVFFLTRLREGDISNEDVQKRVVKTFVNSIYVSEDNRVTINLNCTGKEKTVTLEEMKNAGSYPRAIVEHRAHRTNLRRIGPCVSITVELKKRSG